MNYRLAQDRFLEIKEREGVIENNGSGYIEIAIVEGDKEPIKDENIFVEKHGKYYFRLKENEKLYGRSLTFLVCDINVSEVSIEGSDAPTPTNVYTKEESDRIFVKKDGNKVLSDNNFTNEDKERLDNIKANMVTFEDGETFQEKLNKGTLKGQEGKSAYDLAKESGYTGSVEQYSYSLKGSNAPLPLKVKLEKTEEGIGYKYENQANVNQTYKKGVKPNMIIDEVSHIDKVVVKGLPSEVKALRCDTVSFIGYDDNGVNLGSTNPSRFFDGRKDMFPYLKELDPTKDITFPIINGVCEITADWDYKEVTDTDLKEMQKYFDPKPTRVGKMTLIFALLGSSNEVIDKFFIDITYVQTVKDNTVKPLISFSDLIPKMMSNSEKDFTIKYVTEIEYERLEKEVNDKVVYMILNEITGNITFKVYRP